MFKPSALLSWLMPCCATGTTDISKVKALLDQNNIGILSAACCDSTASSKDQALQNNLREAMDRVKDSRAVIVDTITSAQQNLRTLEAQADTRQKQLIQNVVSLFQSNGLSIFPLLIVNGRVAFYGGVPSIEMIQDTLRKQPLLALDA
ncbi:MAG: hypothetical protein HEQ39_17145 [Rhizobacter sp.]